MLRFVCLVFLTTILTTHLLILPSLQTLPLPFPPADAPPTLVMGGVDDKVTISTSQIGAVSKDGTFVCAAR